MTDDPYAVLGVERTASPQELKSAYRRRARELHPDRNSAPDAAERFKALAAAWEKVGDPEKRRRYELSQGRIERGHLPEEFLAAVGDAIDRAESWIRGGVLPSYARYLRGHGAELAARLLADVDDLVVPRNLPPAGWLARRRVARRADAIVVTALMTRGRSATLLIRGRGFWEIAIVPAALWDAGIREPDALDDAVLRVLLARYAQVLGGGYLVPGEDGVAMVEHARAIDTASVRRDAWRYGKWALIASIVGLMWVAGYNQW